MRVGIVGLPRSGKTTVFNALTGAHGQVGGYHAAEQVAIGVLRVPDERLEALRDMFHPEEALPATIEFEDIGGAFAHLTGGEQSGRALAALRECDAVLMVLRAFQSQFVPGALGSVDPAREFRAMTEELLLADLSVIEHRLGAIARELKRHSGDQDALAREKELLERCRQAIEQQEGVAALRLNPEEEKLLRSYSFLTLKPRLCVVNIGEGQIASPPRVPALEGLEPPPIYMCAELEMGLMELDEADRAAFMKEAGLKELASGQIVRACYQMLGLRSFFTYAANKVRAWTVPAGTDARSAAGKVHSDMERGFVRAEVIGFEDLMACGSIKEARARGKLRMEGKDYIVQDGDVITFHFTR